MVVPPSPENVITSDLQPGASLDMYDSNVWQGTVNGQNLRVFAGVIGASNGQGEYPNDSTTGDITTWSNTTARVVNSVQLPGSGMLTIESYSEDTLAVKSASGKSYTFNMVSGVLSAS
ncbi:MAG: hypothetical protein HKL80_07850 [Acidimicrobiales bacterium]|nr:hypothetical protein [Acidimicrobiales bacterium]